MLLILKVKLHPALAILGSAILLGIISGMPLSSVPGSIALGVGNLMGHVALVIGLGAVLGHLLASSGGAAALGEGLVSRCGPRLLPLAMMLMGMLVGFPVFFEVGLILLMPIVVSVAKRSGRSAIITGMPTLAGLSIVHGLIPPHPAAMLAVVQYHADVGRTILMGLAVGLPAAFVGGPVWAWAYARWIARSSASHAVAEDAGCTESLAEEFETDAAVLPTVPVSRVLAPSALMLLLMPVMLIFLGSWADVLTAANTPVNAALHLVGDPSVALLLTVFAAQLLLGRICHWTQSHTLKLTGESFGPIASALLILAAAGGLSRILNDSGGAQATVELARGAHLSPLVLAWLLAATVRLAIGSATVAMAVTTGILAPVAASMGLSGAYGPELLVLSTGSGSLFCSHVNDPGFWIIKEFFGLEVGETLATWSVLETLLSVAGLLGTLLLASVLQ